ncbi:MAG: hypothetical protein RI935_672 [Candidatus Parcubacteria bacterium]
MIIAIVAIAVLVAGITCFGIGYLIYSFTNKFSMNVQEKTKAVDVFVYALLAVSLIMTVSNVLTVIFAAIERKFFDALNYSYVDATYSDVRFAIAALIVVFPLYLILTWYVEKDITKFFYKKDLIVRKFFVFGTLFVTVVTLLGALVSLIYTYLGGEITTRFVLKSGSVFVIAGILFGYYFYTQKRDYAKKTFVPSLFGVLSCIIVIASIVWSISVIGTPKEMRMKRMDDTRLSDLSRIQQEVFNRFQMTDRLPLTLDELNNAFQGFSVPVDPITKEKYEYKVITQPTFRTNFELRKKEMTGEAEFELCATFTTVRELNQRGQIGDAFDMSKSQYLVSNYYYEGDVSPFWNHKNERTCFKRIITKDMYYGR